AFPANLWSGSTLFLAIAVNSDPEMTPREQISSVPFALVAQDAVGDIHPTSVSVNGVKVINSDGTVVTNAVPRVKGAVAPSVNVSGTGVPVQLNQLPLSIPAGGGNLVVTVTGSCIMNSNTTGGQTTYILYATMDDPTAAPLAGTGAGLLIPNSTA